MFLSSVQKQGSLEEWVAEGGIWKETRVDSDKLKEIFKIVLYIFWRLVANKDSEDDTTQFSEHYLGDLVFRGYCVEDFINLIYIYGRSNTSVVESFLTRISELNPNKLRSQFSETLIAGLKKIKNHVRSLVSLAKSHFDKSGLTNTEDWPEKIRYCINESVNIQKEMYMMAKFFPSIMGSAVWASDVLIVLSNFYILISDHKKLIWEEYVFEKRWLNTSTQQLKKLIFKTIVMFLKKHYFAC